MEGPTPVSALIHAATMVTAGVYLIVRCHSVFEAAPHVQQLAAGLGAATLLLAGLIALVQVDIKRVIAYSTMSQIGYMFVGAGVGAYANAEFHLLTHAFFKALLFLAAGLVIHALAGEQDIRKMGGVGRLMPVTRITFLIGSLALVADARARARAPGAFDQRRLDPGAPTLASDPELARPRGPAARGSDRHTGGAGEPVRRPAGAGRNRRRLADLRRPTAYGS